jgi:hypothetical protein
MRRLVILSSSREEVQAFLDDNSFESAMYISVAQERKWEKTSQVIIIAIRGAVFPAKGKGRGIEHHAHRTSESSVVAYPICSKAEAKRRGNTHLTPSLARA